MQFHLISNVVRKLYMLKEEGFITNPRYQEELLHFLPKDEFTIFHAIFEVNDVQKAIENTKRSYLNARNKQYVINILSQPKLTQIATILLKGSKPESLEKAIRLREQTDKSSLIFMEFVQSIENKLIAFLISRVSKFPNTLSPDDYLKTLNRAEISISTTARYFGGGFEKAYLNDKGTGRSYFELLVCKVLLRYKFIKLEDVQRMLLVFIWNAIPSFKAKPQQDATHSIQKVQ